MTHFKLFASPLVSSTPKLIQKPLLNPYENFIKQNTQTRVYGVYLSLYSWILWCCDYYQLDLPISIAVIITGALFLWWKYPCANSISQSTLGAKAKHNQYQKLKLEIPTADISYSKESTLISTSSAILPTVVSTISLECQSSTSEEPVSILAQEHVPSVASHSRVSQEVGLEEIPAYPPPPYYKSKAIESPKPGTQSHNYNHNFNYTYSHSQNHMLYYYGCSCSHYICLNLAVCGLGVYGWILYLELWRCESWICPQSLTKGWPRPFPDLIALIACAGILASSITVVYTILPRFFYSTQYKQDSVTEVATVDAGAILPKCVTESNEKSGVHFKKLSVLKEGEHEESTKDLHCEVLQECEPQITSTELEPNMDTSSQRKTSRATKKREGVTTIKKRSPSPILEIALSPIKFPSPVRMVKSKLKILGVLLPVFAPTIVPKPRSWTFPKSKSRESCHGYSQANGNRAEEGLASAKDQLQEPQDATLCKTSGSTSTGSELSVIKANGSLLSPSSSSSRLALWKLARMALDLGKWFRTAIINRVALELLISVTERLDSIIHFYKHKHTAATEISESGNSTPQEKDELAFVVRSSRLPTVRVGLYGATQKRLWTSTGSIDMASAEYLKESNEAYKSPFNVKL